MIATCWTPSYHKTTHKSSGSPNIFHNRRKSQKYQRQYVTIKASSFHPAHRLSLYNSNGTLVIFVHSVIWRIWLLKLVVLSRGLAMDINSNWRPWPVDNVWCSVYHWDSTLLYYIVYGNALLVLPIYVQCLYMEQLLVICTSQLSDPLPLPDLYLVVPELLPYSLAPFNDRVMIPFSKLPPLQVKCFHIIRRTFGNCSCPLSCRERSSAWNCWPVVT